MSDTLPTNQADEPETDQPSPEVSFARTFLGRVAAILRADGDEAKQLVGAAKLTATVLSTSGRPYITKGEFETLQLWKRKHAALQATINRHGNTAADDQWLRQYQTLHEKVGEPDFDHSQILSQDEIRAKFHAVRQSATAAQVQLWRDSVKTARAIAARVVPILSEQADSLAVSERSRFESFGLPYPGHNAFESACREAIKFVQARVGLTESSSGPTEVLPYVLL